MSRVLLTVDTELSLGSHQRGVPPEANEAKAIFGETAAGAFGIGWQAELLAARGLTAVFFVDPVPAALFGDGWLKRCIAAVRANGHEVQLHIHTEWLRHLPPGVAPVAEWRTNIGDYDEDEQVALIGWARDLLVAAGAPEPTAFRAGNFGASDATLRALARLGIAWDSSVNAAMPESGIGWRAADLDAAAVDGVAELPVTLIADRPGRLRPAQLCALSWAEMRAMLDHAAASGLPLVNIVSHSFELLSRDRKRPNRAAVRRFEQLCAYLAAHRDRLPTTGFAGLALPAPSRAAPLAASWPRTLGRMAEQAWATARYELA